jgi:hypothetical protein
MGGFLVWENGGFLENESSRRTIFLKTAVFSYGKMAGFWKIKGDDVREIEYLWEFEQMVARGEFGPLEVEVTAREVIVGREMRYRADAVLAVGWGERRVALFAEHKGGGNPRAVLSALETLEQRLDDPRYGVVLVEHLSAAALEALRERRMSGMDLCGNYIIQTPELLALRLDQPNRFPSRAIQNIYGGQSALVSRLALVTAPLPVTLAEWSKALEARGGRLAISTISKVLAGLREDAMLSVDRDMPRLLRPLKLLEQLAAAYKQPAERVTLKLKLPTDEAQREALLGERLGEAFMWSGDTSASRYGAGMPPTVARGYVSSTLRAAEWRDVISERFYNCTISEVSDADVYFDRRGAWSSPVQSYLELASGDARGRELAQSVSLSILRDLEGVVDNVQRGGL